MNKKLFIVLFTIGTAMTVAVSCSESATEEKSEAAASTASAKTYGPQYASMEEWGKHLVSVGGCGDCHTPKKMTDQGPVQDSSRLLMGHPAGDPPPPFDQKDAGAKGLGVTQTLTAWTGPWGTTYAGNITSDSTGIGNWTVEQLSNAIRKGMYKGLANNRPIMPPMPVEAFINFTDDEVAAIYAYLKSTPPIKNVVPAYQPPTK